MIIDNADLHRYEIRVDGELAGFVQYRRRPGLIAFIHTEIDTRFEGQGLGSKLIASVLDEPRASPGPPCCRSARSSTGTSSATRSTPRSCREEFRSEFNLH